jgi:hypothetical protein
MPYIPPSDPQAVAQRRKLEQALDRAIPDWRGFDRNPHWHAWLCGTHLYSEASRGWHLDNAAARGDADSVIGFYRDFLAQQEGAIVHEQPQARAVTARGRPVIYSRSDIISAHRDFMKGAYRGREAEYEALQAEFQRASAEGRIRDALPLSKTR